LSVLLVKPMCMMYSHTCILNSVDQSRRKWEHFSHCCSHWIRNLQNQKSVLSLQAAGEMREQTWCLLWLLVC